MSCPRILLLVLTLVGCSSSVTPPDAVPGDVDPIRHARDQQGPASLRVDDTTLHWVNEADGSIVACDRASGEMRTLVSDIDGVSEAFAVSDTHVYWTTWTAGAVMRISRDGGDPEILNDEGLSRATGMVVADAQVYIALFGGALFRIPAAGGSAVDLGWPGEVSPVGPVLVDGYLYVGVPDGIRRLQVGDGSAVASEWELLSDDPQIGGLSELTVDERFIYGSSLNESRLFRVPTDGGDLTIITEEVQVLQIAVDDSRLFVSTQYGVGYIPFDESEVVQLAGGGGLSEEFIDTHDFELSSGRIWWATRAFSEPTLDGSIWSLPKPN